jgi:hypothetical protein
LPGELNELLVRLSRGDAVLLEPSVERLKLQRELVVTGTYEADRLVDELRA